VNESLNFTLATPGWAEENGDVERFIQTVKKSAKVAKIVGKAFKQEVQRRVGSYRATPPSCDERESTYVLQRDKKRSAGKGPRLTRKKAMTQSVKGTRERRNK